MFNRNLLRDKEELIINPQLLPHKSLIRYHHRHRGTLKIDPDLLEIMEMHLNLGERAQKIQISLQRLILIIMQTK
jgi:hypothetical protein